jgi:hypothetical protein
VVISEGLRRGATRSGGSSADPKKPGGWTLYAPRTPRYVPMLVLKWPSPGSRDGSFPVRRDGEGVDGRPRQDVSGARAGGVPKRSNGADCKSAGIAFGGSNPPPTIGSEARNAGVAQLARASAFQAEGRGFESRLPLCRAGSRRKRSTRSGSSVVERVLGKDEVAGSIPAQSSGTGASLTKPVDPRGR